MDTLQKTHISTDIVGKGNEPSTDHTDKKRIPRIITQTFNNQTIANENNDFKENLKYLENDQDERHYHYRTGSHGDEPDLTINQLLLKDFSNDISNANFERVINSRNHPYNNNNNNIVTTTTNTNDRVKNLDKITRVENDKKFGRDYPHQHHEVTSNKNKHFYRTSLGDWVFQETVGAGSMGKVKLAKHRYTGELCAIKVVNRATKIFLNKQQSLPNPKGKDEILERETKLQKEISRDKRTIREASLGQILFHPNICKLYEMCTLSNHFYMVFEYISGGQLLDYIVQHGSLKENMARKIARSIASALQYLHANNVVHRDLKIENVMISKDGEIKLIDFGLSNLYNKNDRLKTFCGSLYFAAPELLRAHPYIGPEIDIWSFGVILYVLVCGKIPFDDENSSVLHEKIKRGKVTYPSFLSIEVISLLTRMLVVNPLNRATLKEVVNHHWMVHGYNGDLPESYLKWRTPLTPSSIDDNVLKEMYHLEFVDNVIETRRKIIDLIQNEEYIKLSIEHEKLYSYTHLNSKSKKINIAFDDPLIAYHPLISIYHLIFEWLQRKSNISNEEMAINNLMHGFTNIDEEHIETKSEPILKQTTQEIETKIGTLNAGKSNNPNQEQITVLTTSNQDEQELYRPRHVLIPPKLTAKAKVCTAPSKKNHFDPSDNAIPSGQTALNKNVSIKKANDTVKGTASSNIPEKKKISTLLRRFSLKVSPSIKEEGSSVPTSQGNSNQQNMIDHFNHLRESLESQNKHNRTMSENDETTKKIIHLLNNNYPPNQKENHSYDSKQIINKEYSTTLEQTFHESKKNPLTFDPNTHLDTLHASNKNKNRTLSVGCPRQNTLNFLRSIIPNYENVIDSNVFLESTKDDFTKYQKDNSNNETSARDQMQVPDPQTLVSSIKDLSGSEIIESAKKAPIGSMPSIEYPRSLFLRGFFSVQTTSSKPLPIVRYKIIKVLQEMNIKFQEVKGGFLCIYRLSSNPPETNDPTYRVTNRNELPSKQNEVQRGFFHKKNSSIPNNTFVAIVDSNPEKMSPDATTKIQAVHSNPSSNSFELPVRSYNGTPTSRDNLSTVKNYGNNGSSSLTFENSLETLLLVPSKENNYTLKQSEPEIVKFQIHIVKVKIINLAGIHFKKVSGNTWIYKNIAGKILKNLQL